MSLAKEVANRIKSNARDGYEMSEAEAVGRILANYFKWDGLEVLKATYTALEESNYHTVNETIEKLIAEVENES